MKNKIIGVIDSGIGGLTMLCRLTKLYPNETFVYFGDNENVPYGNKPDRELSHLLYTAIENLNQNYDIKFLVVGCNTLSTSVLSGVKGCFNFPIFGVYPPIILDDKKSLLICTEKTATEYQKYNLNLTILKLPNFARLIEDYIFNLPVFDVANFLPYKKGAFDRVILGCTHYEFKKNEIFDHLKPQEILCGQDFTINFIKKFYKNRKSSVKTYQNQILFFGKTAKFNQEVWNLVVKDVKLYDKK